MHSLTASCDCRRLALTFTTLQAPASIAPRACDCGFCTRHGAAYLSDPAGSVRFERAADAAVLRYRQGSATAEFVLCGHCGVLLAVTYDDGVRLLAACNARAFEDVAFGDSVPASPKRLSTAEKRSRWSSLWTPVTQGLPNPIDAEPLV